MKRNLMKKIIPFFLVCILFSSTLSLSIENKQTRLNITWELPEPIDVEMILENSIFRRMSVREFTDSPVSEEELATVLWAAYGLIEDGNRTVSKINREYAAVIYVLNEEGVYTYDPLTHILHQYLKGDQRDKIDILQYETSIQLGLCWNTSRADPNKAGVELGQIGQNIQFMANALNLGTVVTGQIPPAIDPVGLPDDHEGMILMPLGKPENQYDFVDRPMWISVLPKIQSSESTLTEALKNIKQKNNFDTSLTYQEFSQVIWSTYGFSQYLDKSEQEPIHLKRHRTVPSAHGYYPLNIYVITEQGIYQYYPNLLTDVIFPTLGISDAQVDFIGLPVFSYLRRLDKNDVRDNFSQYCDFSALSSASLIIVLVLDLEKSKELSIQSARRFWYYEAGSVAHNVLLEVSAWDLSSKIIYPIDVEGIQSVIGLDEMSIPLLVLPVGG